MQHCRWHPHRGCRSPAALAEFSVLYVAASAQCLPQVNVVDTPGTNVILGRQQRLTEEYVPRADLVRSLGSSVLCCGVCGLAWIGG